jgi:hypothetical protein
MGPPLVVIRRNERLYPRTKRAPDDLEINQGGSSCALKINNHTGRGDPPIGVMSVIVFLLAVIKRAQ